MLCSFEIHFKQFFCLLNSWKNKKRGTATYYSSFFFFLVLNRKFWVDFIVRIFEERSKVCQKVPLPSSISAMQSLQQNSFSRQNFGLTFLHDFQLSSWIYKKSLCLIIFNKFNKSFLFFIQVLIERFFGNVYDI